MSVKSVVFDYLDNLSDGSIFSGWELYTKINGLTGRSTYPSTLLGYCRDYCSITDSSLECLDNQTSRYKFHKGKIRLDGFMPFGKE